MQAHPKQNGTSEIVVRADFQRQQDQALQPFIQYMQARYSGVPRDIIAEVARETAMFVRANIPVGGAVVESSSSADEHIEVDADTILEGVGSKTERKLLEVLITHGPKPIPELCALADGMDKSLCAKVLKRLQGRVGVVGKSPTGAAVWGIVSE